MATPNSLLAFHSEVNRACCSCGLIGSKLSSCSKCKVYRYCSRECQSKHWKNHKKTCKAPSSSAPPMQEICPLAIVRDDMEKDDSDLDEKYKYIVVSPLPVKCQQDFWLTARGVNDDCELDTLLAYNGSVVSVTEEEQGQLSVLRERYQWPGGIFSAVVPGYSADWGGTDLYAFFSDSCTTEVGATCQPLAPNATAGYALMKADTACRGVVVFAAKVRVGGSVALTSSCGESEAVRISRRDILLLAEYNFALGGLGTVSARVHFENIRRAESLAHLRSQSYTII